MRLSQHTATQLATGVEKPRYDRSAPATGIVHIGIGAFHRAHQAVYTEDANAATRDVWSITGVSLRSPAVAAQLNPQDGLYTVCIRSTGTTQNRLIGAVREVLVAPQDPPNVIAAIAAPQTQIVSITISEKGYCRNASGQLDLSLAGGDSLYRYLRDGLLHRHQTGLGGLTLLSCDNLAANGQQLRSLLTQYLNATAPQLTRWVEDHCTCPATMVDRIVPASTAADIDHLSATIGLRDEAAVFTEPFSQWVIEDRFAGPRPHWEAGGAQFTDNVHAFETAKLRMLNGAHSALAYLGLARGHEFVHQAVADPPLRALVEQLLLREAATSIAPAPGQDLDGYATALLQRFGNAALNHRLIQISMDGSQKIPQRWLETLAFHQRKGESCPAILTALGAWMNFVRGDQRQVDDPRAAPLAQLWNAGNAAAVVDGLFGPQGMFSTSWVASNADRATLLAGINSPAVL